jgi:hypothetical protein
VSEYDVGCARAIVHAGGVGVVVIGAHGALPYLLP